MNSADFKVGMIAAFALVSLLLVPFFGQSVIWPAEIFDDAGAGYLIFWRIRLPRCIGAFMAGAGLSLCGLAFQVMFRNPLATPFTLGISSGAAFGASLYLRTGTVIGLAGLAGCMACSLAGCFLAMSLVYGITRARGGLSTSVMLLAGVIANFFFSSLLMFMQYVSDANDTAQIIRWLMGSVSGIDTAGLWQMAIVVFAGFWIFTGMAPELDLLLAGEELAKSRGVDVRRIKLRIFIVASLVVGIIVSSTGPIGFVGMMIPQICRLMLGAGNMRLIPAAFFMGGGFLVVCDLLARTLLAPAELPIGILTSMAGAPFFLWTLLRHENARGYE